MDKRQTFLRRLPILLAVLAACGAAVFLLLWLNPHRVYTHQARTLSQAQAVKACPFALITQEEFDLSAQLLANPEVTGLFSGPDAVNPPAHDLDFSLVDPGLLRIDGQDVHVTALTVMGQSLYVDYSTLAPEGRGPASRCILAVSQDGEVSKTSGQYQDGEALYIVDNWGNETFVLMRRHRDLLYFLHD